MKKYIVQYEVEFAIDKPSINDIVEIYADDEYEAMSNFNNDETLCNKILDNHPGSMCVTSNAAWDE